MVGTCIGAGQRDRALRAAWVGAGLSLVMTESIGLAAALFPRAWLELFGHDPAMVQAGTIYLRTVGPAYGLFGLGLVLYFASQGAGRLKWPVIGNIARLGVAAGGGWWVLHAGGDLFGVFIAQAAALAVYGLVNAAAVAGGAWFGPLAWPRRAPRRIDGHVDGPGSVSGPPQASPSSTQASTHSPAATGPRAGPSTSST
jgi:Na+-driven multidrug efflux pump